MGTAHLFVYGTLMSSACGTFGRTQRWRLERESSSLGPGTAQGQLYDLGEYPGLVDGPGVVHGEVVALPDAEETFRWLDIYEGIDPGDHAGGDYQRVVRVVVLLAGEEIEAWLYLYKGDIDGARPLPDGRWTRRPSRT